MVGRIHPALVVAVTALIVVSVAAPGVDGFGERASDPSGHADAVSTAQAASGFESGGEYWRGVQLRFDGSGIVEDPAEASTGERTFAVWRVGEDGRLVERIDRFSVNEDGEADIDTAGFRGRVVLQYENRPVHVRDGTGYRASGSDGQNATIENSAWRVTPQTLDASFAERYVYEGQTTELDLRSDRAEYEVAVTSPSLEPVAVARLFTAAGVDVRRNGDRVLLDAGERTRVPIDVTGIDPGEYAFEFDVTDTTASAVTRMNVQGERSTRIAEVEREERTGDYLEATVECDQCYLFVGGPGQGLLDVVELEDRNGDGRVVVGVNTRYAGLSESNVPSAVDVYRAGPDSADRFSPGDRVAPSDVMSRYGLGRVRSETGLDAAGRRAPLETGTYDLTVATSPEVSLHPGYDIQDERHVQSVRLTDPSIGGVETAVMSRDVAGPVDLDAIRTHARSGEQVAVGDRLVLEIDVSGVFGNVIGAHDGRADALLDNREEGIELTLSGGRRGLRLDSSTRLVVDEERGRLYAVVDTGSLRFDRPPGDGRQYRATVTLDGDTYPYLAAGETRSASAAVTLVEPTAPITSATIDSGRLRLAGESTLAPGSILTLRAATSGAYSWTAASGVVVGDAGTWEGSIDVRNAPGGQFSAHVYENNRQLSATWVGVDRTSTPDGTVAGTPTPITDTTTATVATPPTDAGETASPTGTTTVPTPSTTTETTGPATPSTTESSSNTGGPTPPDPSGEESGVPFVPGLPRLPGPVAVAIVAVSIGGIGGAAFLARRP